MNAPWDAAQATLALALECLGDRCDQYQRHGVDTSPPVFDCSSITVVIGGLRALNGDCVGRSQMIGSLDVTLVRCCEPAIELSSTAGYTPPSAEEIEAAAACIAKDAWQILSCISCDACSTIGAVQGVTACCDKATGPPEIIWGNPNGGCRSAIIRVPLVFSVCC